MIKRMPVEVIYVRDGFDAVTPGTQEPILNYGMLTYGRNAASRDDYLDDPDESIKTFQNPEDEPKDKKPDKTARLRGFATIDDRIAQALRNQKRHKRAK